jgi:hypothetical protein
VLDRRLGLKALLAVLVVAVAVVAGLSQLVAKDSDDPPEATASVTAAPSTCDDSADPYGTAPDGFVYEKVDEATRTKTVKALNLNESGGTVDMRAARREGLTLGTLVGVPSADPSAYVSELVKTASTGGAPVSKKKGYSVIPLTNSVVAVGVRGCRAVLITATDPTAVPFLADAVFASPAG